jgi:hypothetical protein
MNRASRSGGRKEKQVAGGSIRLIFRDNKII